MAFDDWVDAGMTEPVSKKKASWRKEEKDDRDRDVILAEKAKEASERARNFGGYCREVVKAFYEENCRSERRKIIFDMTDEQWEMWGGTIVQRAVTHTDKAVSVSKSFWDFIFFWRS